MQKPTRLQQVYSPTGSVSCLPLSTSDLNGALERYLAESESALHAVHDKSLALLNSFHVASERLVAFSEELRVLSGLQTMAESGDQRTIYLQMSKVLEGWSRHQAEMQEELSDRLSAHFLYRLCEVSSLKSLLKDLALAYKSYCKEEKNLLARKEKLWSQWGLEEGSIGPLASDKVSAFAIMLPAETRDLEAQKHFLAYLHFQVRSEVQRLLLQERLSEQKHFKKLASHCDEKSQEMSTLWREAMLVLSRFFSPASGS